MTNWRITTEVIAYIIPGTDQLYLAAPEKKQYQAAVTKLIQDTYTELRLGSSEVSFKVAINGSNLDPASELCPYISSPLLPKGREWWRVMNFYAPHLGYLLVNLGEKGNFTGHVFETAFSETTPYVTLTCPSLGNYNTCLQEMRRRMNCEIFKKTKKWIPGHRYDSQKSTKYYIAPLLSRKKDETNSEYISDVGIMPEVYLYVENVREGDKTISDVLKHNSFGAGDYDLKISYTMESMVDSGEVLKDDFSGNIQDYQDIMWANTAQAEEHKTKYGYVSYEYPKFILDTLAYQSPGHLGYTSKTKSLVTCLLEQLIEDCIVCNWGKEKYRDEIAILPTKTLEQNTEACMKLFYSTFRDGNPLKNLYYSQLFSEIGINLKDIVKTALSDWSDTKTVRNLETYLRYYNYHSEKINASKVRSTQRVKSVNYKIDVVTLKDLFGETVLKDTMVDIINEARNNFGYGVSEYTVRNVGTKKDPKEYISCKVQLEDIISHFGGIDKVPENLKNEILSSRFVWSEIIFDKDGEIL